MLNGGYVGVLAPLYLSPSLAICEVVGAVDGISVEVLAFVVGTLGSFFPLESVVDCVSDFIGHTR